MSFCILKRELLKQVVGALREIQPINFAKHSPETFIRAMHLEYVEKQKRFQLSGDSDLTLVISPGVPTKPPQAPATAAIPKRLEMNFRLSMYDKFIFQHHQFQINSRHDIPKIHATYDKVIFLYHQFSITRRTNLVNGIGSPFGDTDCLATCKKETFLKGHFKRAPSSILQNNEKLD